MDYTLLLRDSQTLRINSYYIQADSPQDAVDRCVRDSGGRCVPIAWAEGFPNVLTIHHQAEREDLAREWVTAGHGVRFDVNTRTFHAVVPNYVYEIVRALPPINQGSASKVDPSAERDFTKRPPLDWNKPTRFDPFKDFVVENSSEVMSVRSNGREFGRFVLPDTQPTGNLVDPSFAMAAQRSQS